MVLVVVLVVRCGEQSVKDLLSVVGGTELTDSALPIQKGDRCSCFSLALWSSLLHLDVGLMDTSSLLNYTSGFAIVLLLLLVGGGCLK